MIYLKRLKGKNSAVNSFGMNDFLKELHDKSMTYAHALHDEIVRIINGIAENHQGEQPRKRASRDGGMTALDLTWGLAGIGLTEGMRAQNLICLTLPNKIIEKIEETPFIGPYIPGTLTTRIGILIGNGLIFIPEFTGQCLGVGGTALIPGTTIPIPGTEYIKPTFDEIKDGVDDVIEWGVDQVPKIFDLPGYIWDGAKSGFETGLRTSSELVNEVSDSAGHVVNMVNNIVDTGIGMGENAVSGAIGAVSDGATAGIGTIGSAIGDIASGDPIGAGTEIGSGAVGQLQNGYNLLLSEGKNVWNGVTEIANDVNNGFISFGYGIYGIPGTIIGE